MTAKDVPRTLGACKAMAKELGFTVEPLIYGQEPNVCGAQFRGFAYVVTVFYKRTPADRWRFREASADGAMDHEPLHTPTELRDRLQSIAQAGQS